MALTSADVNNQSFSIDRKGYNVDEVDVFLERVASELDELNGQVDSLKMQLRTVREDASGDGVSRLELDKRDQRIRELEAQLTERRADDSAIAQALIIAQRSADEILINANQNAEVTRQDAEDEAQRIVDKANAEKQRILDDIKKLEDDREDARSHYVDMLNDFISSSNDLLVDLEGKKLLNSKSGRATHGGFQQRSGLSSQAAVATYTTPTVAPSAVMPSAPRPSQVEKDFSGFGDTEDSFELDDLD